jgi:hypothetical protein
MNAQYQDNKNIIARALNAEASAYTKGGLAWLAFSPIAQYLLFLWFRKTQIMQPSTVVFFALFSLPLAWWPLFRGIRHLRRARRINSPQDLFRRALTVEPQLIAHINLGNHTTIWIKLLNLVLTLLSAGAHSLKNSWDQYGLTGSGESSGIQLPCIVVKLTNNEEHRLTTTRDSENLKELIAALRAHAPHAIPAPEPESTADDWLNEPGWKSSMRVLLLLFGVPLLVIGSIIVFVQYVNARERADLEQHGVRTTATVSSLSDYGGKGSDYHVAVDFTDQNGKAIHAGTVKLVTKSDFQKLKVGAPVEIFYMPHDPQDFRLVISLQRLDADKGLFIVFSILSSIGLIMVLIAVISIARMRLRKRAGRFAKATEGAMAASRP